MTEAPRVKANARRNPRELFAGRLFFLLGLLALALAGTWSLTQRPADESRFLAAATSACSAIGGLLALTSMLAAKYAQRNPRRFTAFQAVLAVLFAGLLIVSVVARWTSAGSPDVRLEILIPAIAGGLARFYCGVVPGPVLSESLRATKAEWDAHVSGVFKGQWLAWFGD